MIPQLLPLGYSPRSELAFHRALMAAAQDYLRQHNEHRFADYRAWLKSGAIVLFGMLFYLFSLQQQQVSSFLLCYFLFLMMGMLLAMNVSHDAAHGAWSRSRKGNRWLQRLIALWVGNDPDYWRERHVEFHHIWPNVERYDLDIEENGILRQTPFQRWHPHMRYQHVYWPLIAALSLPYIIWVFDWSDRLGRTPLAARSVLTGIRGWLLFLAGKCGHLLLTLIIPLLICQQQGIGWPWVLLAYLLGQMVSSLVVVMLILGTHWAESAFYRIPDEGNRFAHGWYQHTFSTTCDWMPAPRWLGNWLGGLHLHLTHHLFPGWHHRHYPALAAIVAELAPRYGFEYRLLDYRQLLHAQLRFLRAMGDGERSKKQ